MRFRVLGMMPFVVQAGAEKMPWVEAILAKGAEHASRSDDIGVGHWTAEEWQDLETSARRGSQQQQQQQQQQSVDKVPEVPANMNLPLGKPEAFMKRCCSDKASRAQKDSLTLKTRELVVPRVPFREQCRTYFGYEQMAIEEFLS